jgi:hypothetical protein
MCTPSKRSANTWRLRRFPTADPQSLDRLCCVFNTLWSASSPRIRAIKPGPRGHPSSGPELLGHIAPPGSRGGRRGPSDGRKALRFGLGEARGR